MAESSATAPSLVRLDRSALRIVLFGMPAAGKSSLLGALAQAAQTQEHLLNGRLKDLSGGLAELNERLYGNHPQATVEEIVPYPVAFENLEKSGGDSFVLVDCDGRVANDLLTARR